MDDLIQIKISLATIEEGQKHIRNDVKDIKKNISILGPMTTRNRLQIALLKRDAYWKMTFMVAGSSILATAATLAVEYFRKG